MHPTHIERERPLARCPMLGCRRAGRCLREGLNEPCHRSHESLDDFRYRLAAKLKRLTALYGRKPGAPLSPYELDLALARLKEALQDRLRGPQGLKED